MEDNFFKTSGPKKAPQGKDARLVTALRENLRKRKAQMRERAQAQEALQTDLTDGDPNAILVSLRCPSGR